MRPGAVLSLAALVAAGAARAQQGQVAPYVDTIQPPPRLAPVPNDPLDRIYPPPARPEPIPQRSVPVAPAPLGGGRLEPTYPQGSAITTESGRAGATTRRDGRRELNLPGEIGPGLAACWRPPTRRTAQATVRLSFRKDGSILGEPRVTFFAGEETQEARAQIVGSLLAAIRACAPLRFTPSLGSAIAGRPISVRFIWTPPGAPA